MEALTDTGAVTRAAAMVNMSAESAYYLRRQPGAESFRRAWEAALDFGTPRLKDIAYERAMEGDLVPVIAGGKLHGYRRVRNDRLLMFAIHMNDRTADNRRLSATQFPPRAGTASAPTVTLEGLTPSEALDEAAARLAAFVPVDLEPSQQAEIYERLAAEARRRAALPVAADPSEPFVTPAQLQDAGLHPFHSPHQDAPDPERSPGEAPWGHLHDEAGLQAIDDAVAQVKAAKAAGYFDDVVPPQTPPEALGLAVPRTTPDDAGHGRADAGNPAHPEPRRTAQPIEAASQPVTDPLLENVSALGDPAEPPPPRPAKPKRPYKKRTPKPRFDPMDYRNYK